MLKILDQEYYCPNTLNLERKPIDFENIEIKITDKRKTRNKKLDRQRGLAWEDELTSKLNQFPLTSAYNLGGSTNHIPDIVVFSNMLIANGKPKQSEFYNIDDNIYRNVKLKDEFCMAIECKATEKDHYNLSNEEIDRCFDFLQRLTRYQRFVVVAVKFKISTKKSLKYYIVLNYNPAFQSVEYDYLKVRKDGTFDFYFNENIKQKKKIVEELSWLVKTDTKLLVGEFDIERI